MKRNNISVVLPAYNEAENIGRVVESTFNFLENHFTNFEIIVVDDGSKDDTYDICNSMVQKLGSRIKVLQHSKNRGYGAALRTGLFSAESELVFYTDADNQFDISELLKFTADIDDYDLIIGYRVGRQDSLARKFTSAAYNLLIRLIFGLKVRDVDCSFKLFKKEFLDRLSIERDGFFVDTEMLIKSKLNNCRLKEIGVKHLPRKCGKSTVNFFHIFETISDIIYFWPKLKRSVYGGNKKT